MATLSNRDLGNRNNPEVFANRIAGKGAFQLDNSESPAYKATGRVKVMLSGKATMFDGNFTESSLRTYLQSRTGSDHIQVELQVGRTKTFYRSSKLFKDKEFGGVASKAGGQGSERQEEGLIEVINEAIAKYEKPTVAGISGDILSAKKWEGLSQIGKEPYTDIIIETSRGKFNVSCKDISAPSLAGGGLAGIQLVTPELPKKFYAAVMAYMKNTMKLKQGDVVPADSVPNFYAEIPSRYMDIILKGTAQMGGPVTHMYIGKMDVVGNVGRSQIGLNGKFFTISEYKRKVGKFYFRLRKRDIDPTNTTKVEYQRTNTEGLPILLKATTTGRNNMRLVIDDKVTGPGQLVRIS